MGKKKLPRSDNDDEDVDCGSKGASPAAAEVKNTVYPGPIMYPRHRGGRGISKAPPVETMHCSPTSLDMCLYQRKEQGI